MASPKPAVEASYSSRGALRDLFTVFDADNSGSLDADEIVVLLEVRPAHWQAALLLPPGLLAHRAASSPPPSPPLPPCARRRSVARAVTVQS